MRNLFIGAIMVLLTACATIPQSTSLPEPGTMKRQFVDGIYGQVHVRVATPPSSVKEQTPLVLFHPSPYSSAYFSTFIAEMSKDRLVVAIDSPGFGDSDRPASPPSIEKYAENAFVTLDALGVDQKIDTLGFHTGTIIAAEMAIQQPERVRRLVLPGVPYYAGDELKSNYDLYAKPGTMERDGSHMKNVWRLSTLAVEDGMPLLRGQQHYSDGVQAAPYFSFAYYGVFSYPGEEKFPQIEQPVLFMTTEGSLKKETEEAHEITPNSNLVHFPQYKHQIFDIGLKDIVAETRTFLDE